MEDTELCQVGYDACEVCCQREPPSAERLNSVVASFLYALGHTVVEAGGLPECTVEEAMALKARAFRHLEWAAGSVVMGRPQRCLEKPDAFRRRRRTYSCDVVLCCADSSPQTERALRSVLDQTNAMALVHLVDVGGGGAALAERYASSGNVWYHCLPPPSESAAGRVGDPTYCRSPLAAAHALIDRMRTEFIVVQDARTVSRPFRVSYSVGLLEEHGGDLLGAGLKTPAGNIAPSQPEAEYDRYVAPETLVVRRAAFVDMGGVANRPGDEDAEFIFRAVQEKRLLLLADEHTVETQTGWRPAPLGPPPVYELCHGCLRHQARGFPQQRVACDVVLPFWGQQDYVQRALEALLAQEDADVVIHLVDDGTPANTDEFLRSWRTHPQVRTYRNVRNLSQFTTFNNILPFCETDLIAVQDGDDISLPHRICCAGNTLRLAGADIFGSAVVIYDDGEQMHDEDWRRMPADITVRRWKNLGVSAWPTPSVYWFLFNPTMVLRTEVFRELGGFGDFGGAVRNRCGHDIEFCLRAYHLGKRFAISREPTVLYRQHPSQTTRNPHTGFGTEAEVWTTQEARRRGELYRRTRFDPLAFGALGKYQHLTQRVCG